MRKASTEAPREETAQDSLDPKPALPAARRALRRLPQHEEERVKIPELPGRIWPVTLGDSAAMIDETIVAVVHESGRHTPMFFDRARWQHPQTDLGYKIMAMWALALGRAGVALSDAASVPMKRDHASRNLAAYIVTVDGKRVGVSDLTPSQAVEQICRLMEFVEVVSGLGDQIGSLVESYHAGR
jgi:hypothetical protein